MVEGGEDDGGAGEAVIYHLTNGEWAEAFSFEDPALLHAVAVGTVGADRAVMLGGFSKLVYGILSSAEYQCY